MELANDKIQLREYSILKVRLLAFKKGKADLSGKAVSYNLPGKSFYVKKYKAYAWRNLKTGKPIKVKPKKLPFSKPGKELKERIDY